MKQLLLKYAPLFIALTALADRKFDLLIQIGLSKQTIGLIELLGLILALFLPSIKESFKNNTMNRELDNTDPFNTNIPKGTKV